MSRCCCADRLYGAFSQKYFAENVRLLAEPSKAVMSVLSIVSLVGAVVIVPKSMTLTIPDGKTIQSEGNLFVMYTTNMQQSSSFIKVFDVRTPERLVRYEQVSISGNASKAYSNLRGRGHSDRFQDLQRHTTFPFGVLEWQCLFPISVGRESSRFEVAASMTPFEVGIRENAQSQGILLQELR